MTTESSNRQEYQSEEVDIPSYYRIIEGCSIKDLQHKIDGLIHTYKSNVELVGGLCVYTTPTHGTIFAQAVRGNLE